MRLAVMAGHVLNGLLKLHVEVLLTCHIYLKLLRLYIVGINLQRITEDLSKKIFVGGLSPSVESGKICSP